jgi:3',5'-cyclic AMP phosphodiesterase CpdA
MISGKKNLGRGVLLLLILSMGLAFHVGATETGHLPVRFAVIGDRTGSNVPEVYEQVVAEVMRMRPDLVMTVGDQIEGYHDNTERLVEEWAEYKGIIKPLTMPVYLTPGNHDILSDVQEGVFRDQIGDPYYSFDYEGIHFVIMDNGRWEKSEDLPSEQLEWLIADLDHNRNCEYSFVFMHKPFWFYSTAVGKPDTLHALFRTFGVDAVFTGHFHKYFTGYYNGIKYTNLGSSGGGASPGPSGLLYHFCWVTVDDNEIAVAPIEMGAVLPCS